MKDFVPDDVRRMVAGLENERGAAPPERTTFEENGRARRDTHELELRAACGAIGEWLERFEQTVGPAIWRLAGDGIVLYSARFWNSKPVPRNETAYSAQLRCEPPGQTKGRLVYEELEHGRVSARYWQGGASNLWRSLHPDFVLQCAAHIESGRVWDTIRVTLEQLKRS